MLTLFKARHDTVSPFGFSTWLSVATILSTLLLCGCAGTHPYRAVLDTSLPARAELDQVPFFPQSDLQCGPAALATALNFEGINRTPDQLSSSVFTASRRGSLPLDMLGGARRTGAVAIELPNSLNAVVSVVASGRPAIVLQNLGLSWYPLWHYAVVVGYDVDKGHVILRSGTTRREIISLRTFDNTWARSDRWAMITLQPGEMSKQVDAIKYSAAVVALERLGNYDAAQRAYDAGILRWSDNLILRIGAGNVAYKSGKLEMAETHYRAASREHPNSDAALNNLAQVLADLGKLDEAIATADQALALNGPQAAIAQETARALRAKKSETVR